MSKKKLVILIAIVVVIGGIALIFIPKNKKENKKEEPTKKEEQTGIITVDYAEYQKLRSEVYENETFAILIADTTDDVSPKFRDEILTSFKDRKSKVYEIDTDKLNDAELSGVINDVSTVMKYDKPTIVIPTLLVSKKGKIVYTQEGLAYNPTITAELDKNKIE